VLIEGFHHEEHEEHEGNGSKKGLKRGIHAWFILVNEINRGQNM